MSRLRRIFPAAICALVMMTACSDTPTPAQSIEIARTEIDNANYGRARRVLDNLMSDSTALASMSAAELCEAAEMYITLSQVLADSLADAHDAIAARCLGRASELDADSVSEFIHALPPDQALRLNTLNSVSAYLAIPRDSLVGDQAEPDSL